MITISSFFKASKRFLKYFTGGINPFSKDFSIFSIPFLCIWIFFGFCSDQFNKKLGEYSSNIDDVEAVG